MPHDRKPKPDDRSDNVEKLQEQVVNTIENLEEAHDTLQQDLPEEQRQALLEKNRRREHSIAGKREEIKDEWEFRQERDDHSRKKNKGGTMPERKKRKARKVWNSN